MTEIKGLKIDPAAFPTIRLYGPTLAIQEAKFRWRGQNMEQLDGGLKTYLDEIGRNRVLTREEEVELFKRVQKNDEEARGVIINCNLKFVIRLAQQFKGRGMPLEDLIQEGNIGLLEAISKFDHKLGFRFSTYAAFWIRQSIQVAVRQRGSLIRLPVRKSRQLGFMNEIVQEFWSTKGRPPTENELGERLEITPEKARELAHLGEAVLSLDTPIDEDGAPLMDMVADSRSRPVDQSAIEEERTAKVAAALKLLTDRESSVIHQRFGFGSGVSRSLRNVSSRLGLSQEGVRRIEQRALNKLRRPHVRQFVSGLV